MSNKFEELVNDPNLKLKYFDKIGKYKIPVEYKAELKDLMLIKIELVSDLDNPDSYKTMAAALLLLQVHRDRAAFIMFHIKSIMYYFEQLKKKATTYLELAHYDYLSQVKDSLRKQAITSALEPIDLGIEELEHLQVLTNLVTKRLEDINWTVKTSSDIMSEYFNNCKAFKIQPTAEL